MNIYAVTFSLLLLLSGLFLPLQLYGHHTRGHVTLQCDSDQVLRDFNDRLELGPRLCTMVEQKDYVTVEDELTAKFNAIIEQAKFVLNMYPRNLHVKVVILPTAQDCSAVFARKYGQRENKIAYYSLSENTIYISASDARTGVVAHELGHALGLQHTQDPKALMYPVMQRQDLKNFKLTAADLELLNSRH